MFVVVVDWYTTTARFDVPEVSHAPVIWWLFAGGLVALALFPAVVRAPSVVPSQTTAYRLALALRSNPATTRLLAGSGSATANIENTVRPVALSVMAALHVEVLEVNVR